MLAAEAAITAEVKAEIGAPHDGVHEAMGVLDVHVAVAEGFPVATEDSDLAVPEDIQDEGCAAPETDTSADIVAEDDTPTPDQSPRVTAVALSGVAAPHL